MSERYDVLAMGRSSIDLYANEIGVPFVEIKSFAAYVGGCPTNVSVGCRRLGLRSALLTAVGEDLVGDFVLHFLQKEGVETRFIPRKPGRRTSAVLLGIEPPDRFPLVFYRDNCADIALTLDDVRRAPVRESRVLFLTGTGLSREPSRSATLFAAEEAKAHGVPVFFDLDFRPDQWDDPRAYGLARVATELRAELARLLRQMGAGQVVDLQRPALKLKAYEWQLQGLMTFSERPERYAPLKRTLERLKRVFWGFVERLRLQAAPSP